MHIVHFVDSTDLRDGGVPRFVLDAARVMAQSGYPSTVLTMDVTDAPHAWVSNRMGEAGITAVCRQTPLVRHVAQSRVGGKLLGPQAMRDVRASINQADVVHLHCVWSLANLQIAAACRAMGVPYVISAHWMLDDWSMAQSQLKKKVYMHLGGRTLLERAARVHCTADAEVEQAQRWFPADRAFVAPCMMDLGDFRTLPGDQLAQSEFACVRQAKAEGTPVVLFLSRVHHKKGIELLIEAAAELHKRGERACFVIAGTGDATYVESLVTMTKSLGVNDMVHFVGMVKGATKVSLYQAADLFALPTSQENFGLVLTEAMACGTPVVTTRGTDIWKDIAASGAGIVAERTGLAFADAIGGLLADRNTLAAMASKARPWVFANFSEDVLVNRFTQLYQTAMGLHSQVEAKPLRFAAMQKLQRVAATL
jgi:glycosyltransferase involved in cell wall biosynthesis